MEAVQNAWAKFLKEIKNPRGGLYLILGGVLITIFGCVGISIGNAIEQNSVQGSAGSILAALLLLAALLMVLVGVVIAIIGGVMALIQKQKENAQVAKSNPPIIHNGLSSSIETESKSQPAIAYPTSASGLTIEQRREILQREIHKYLKQGYRVISQTDTTAQLVKSKKFSCLWFLINAILLIGWIFYLLWYWSKRDKQVYIEVDINGNVRIRK